MHRIIYIVHTSPGRTRLRLPWLRSDANEATSLADALLRVKGVQEVQVRPYTGSVLCLHDPRELSLEGLLEAVRRSTGVDVLLRPGEEPPDGDALLRSLTTGSGVARAASTFFKNVNVDVLRATEGHMDLGTLTTLTFAAAGAVEVAVKGKLPPPPWFSLGWWAFQTFINMERVAIRNTEAEVRHNGNGAAAAPGVGAAGPFD